MGQVYAINMTREMRIKNEVIPVCFAFDKIECICNTTLLLSKIFARRLLHSKLKFYKYHE